MNSPRESLSHRAYESISEAHSWEEIWQAGAYYDRVAELLEDATDFAAVVGWQDCVCQIAGHFPTGSLRTWILPNSPILAVVVTTISLGGRRYRKRRELG